MLLGVLRHRATARAQMPPFPKDPGKSSSDIVKWFIPSVGVFAAIVGFVAETAHQGLLGVDRGDLGATAYIWSAGEFVRSVIRAIASAAFLPRFFSADSKAEIWLLVIAVAAGTSMYALKRTAPANARTPLFRRVVFTTLLLVLVAWRLVIVEMPLARIENLLVGGPRGIVEALRYDKVSPAERALLKRAVVFYSFLLCERDQDGKVPDLRLVCESSRDYSTDAVRLMLVTISVSLSMLWLIALLWPSASTATAIVLLAPCALYSCVAPAYLYGKLVKPPTFDSALIQFKTRFEWMPAQSAFRGQTVPAADPAAGRLMTAIILGRDDKLLSLYVNQYKKCQSGEPTYEWVPWQVPIGEVIAVREIISVDVISERFKQLPCPDSPLPP